VKENTLRGFLNGRHRPYGYAYEEIQAGKNVKKKEYTTSTALIDKTLEEKLQRRKKLYHSIETGKLDLSDIAPRIKELNDEIEQLTDEKKKLEEKYEKEQILMFEDAYLKPYIADLRATLMKGTIPERKSFIRNFIKRIYIDYPNLEIEYCLPLPRSNKRTSSTAPELVRREVLSMVQIGDPNRTKVEPPKCKWYN